MPASAGECASWSGGITRFVLGDNRLLGYIHINHIHFIKTFHVAINHAIVQLHIAHFCLLSRTLILIKLLVTYL